MGFFNTINISASGLTAERFRQDLIAENIANANVTRTAAGTPYRRKYAIFRAQDAPSFSNLLLDAKSRLRGVEVAGVMEDSAPFKKIYEPTHPDADENGFVSMPNVEVVNEMINLISASRAYEANITSINATKSMALKALEIGK